MNKIVEDNISTDGSEGVDFGNEFFCAKGKSEEKVNTVKIQNLEHTLPKTVDQKSIKDFYKNKYSLKDSEII